MQLIKCKRCTHIKVTGHPCGSPALRGGHFCYFHARMIKGVRFRVDARVNPSALLEDPESIQVAIMDITTQLIENSIDWRRASLIIRALQIAVRNARNVHFGRNRRRMVREVPNWDRQWMDEHGETPLTKEELEKQVQPAQPPPPNAVTHDSSNHCSGNHCHPALASAQSAAKDPTQRGLTAGSSASSHSSSAHAPAANVTEHHPPLAYPTLPAATGNTQPAASRAEPSQDQQQSEPPHTVTPPNNPRSKPNDDPALSPRQTRQWRELRRVQRSIAGARKGSLSDLKTAFAFAGLQPSK